MAKKDKNKKNPTALNVMPGVNDQHDGLADQRSIVERDGSPRRRLLTAQQYIDGVLSGDRSLLARAITLVESGSPAHQKLAQEVLTALLPQRQPAHRVGITGVPGAGKSTFIETLGTRLTSRGHKVAVLAVDPSSSLTGGSILGDKTRMEKLAADPNAFIRPSPSGGTLGGVARKTRETMMLFEAAGYDVILVETVGVGQSEVLVRSMVDFFLLILISGAGDELQGIKKGVVEIADAILINKADGRGLQAAQLARSEFERVLHYLRPATAGWQTAAFTASALKSEGIDEIWAVIKKFESVTSASGVHQQRRQDQERQWLHDLVREGLANLFKANADVQGQLKGLEDKVANGEMPATAAALLLLDAFSGKSP